MKTWTRRQIANQSRLDLVYLKAALSLHHMEYLTLQDLPHRHCDPLHSRRMAPSQSSERQLGNMAAAVSEAHTLSYSSSPSLSFSTSSPPRLLHPPLLRGSLPGDFRLEQPTQRPWKASTAVQYTRAPQLCHIRLPPFPKSSESSLAKPRDRSRSPERAGSHLLPRSPLGQLYSVDLSRAPPSPCTHVRARGPDPSTVREEHHAMESAQVHVQVANKGLHHLTAMDTTLTDAQNHHMRSSPPIQPGEQNYPGKLPSFSEVSSCRPSSPSVVLTIRVSAHHQSQHASTDALTP